MASFQDLVRRRQGASFIGRRDELSGFEENLHRPITERSLIVAVSGQGGMGKTFLARRFVESATEAGFAIGWTDESEADAVQVMERLARELGADAFRSFLERVGTYRERRRELEADPESPEGLQEALGRAVGVGGLRLARHIPVAGLALELVSEDTAGAQVSSAVSYLAKRLKSKDDVLLVREPLEVLTPLFTDGLRRTARDRPLVLVFDTFEGTAPAIQPWLLALLGGRYGDLPAELMVVIAGREPVDENAWSDLSSVISRVVVEPFSDAEARQFLRSRNLTDEHLVTVILSLSARMPLLLAMLAAGSPTDAAEIGDPSGTAVERFLRWIPDPALRQLAIDSAVPRSLDEDVLAALVGEEGDATETLRWLRSMPFTSPRRDALAYHDVVRHQLLAQLRRSAPARFANLHRRMADHFGAEATGEGDGAERAELERAYHLVGAESDARGHVLERIVRLLATDLVLALRFAAAGAQAERELEIEPPVLSRVATGIAAAEAGDAEVLIDELQRLVEDNPLDLNSSALGRVRVRVSELLLEAGRRDEARSAARLAIAVDPKNIAAHYSLAQAEFHSGHTSDGVDALTAALDAVAPDATELRAMLLAARASWRVEGEPQEALRDADAAVALDDQQAGYLLVRADARAATGNLDGALSDLHAAVELRPHEGHAAAEAAARFLFEAGNAGGAVERLALALRDEPECADCIRRYVEALDTARGRESAINWARSLAVNTETAQLARAHALTQLGEYGAAEAALNALLENDDALARAWVEQGAMRLARAEPEAAVDAFTSAIESDPDRGLPYALRGFALKTIGAWEEAESDFSESLRLGPPVAEEFLHRGTIRLGRNDTTGASGDYAELAHFYLRDKQLLGRAALAIGLGKIDDAERLLGTVMTGDNYRSDWEIVNNAGLTLSYLGRWEEAARQFETVLQADPTNLPALYNLAVVCGRCSFDDFEAAARRVEVLLEQAPDSGNSAYARAGLAALRGDAETVFNQLTRAVDGTNDAVEWALRDPAFAEFRNRAEFVAALEARAQRWRKGDQ